MTLIILIVVITIVTTVYHLSEQLWDHPAPGRSLDVELSLRPRLRNVRGAGEEVVCGGRLPRQKFMFRV